MRSRDQTGPGKEKQWVAVGHRQEGREQGGIKAGSRQGVRMAAAYD